jgi:LPS O-antigen subunit length determinant protein (WzzB/FepE family)
MDAFKNEDKQAIHFLVVVIKNKYKILFAAIVGIVGAIIVTYISPKQYKSSGIVYPINSFTKNDLVTNSQFGSEIDVDRLIQIIESEHIRNIIIKKFNLLKYYNMDSLGLDWKDNLIGKVAKDITFSKSRYMSVVISAKMKDPKLASDIVNEIINQANEFQKQIYMKNINNEIAYKKKECENQERKTDSIVQQIYKIKDSKMNYNIIYNHLISISKDAISNEAVKFVDSPKMEELVNKYKFEKSRFDEIRVDYEKSKLLAQKPFPNIYVIDYAEPSYKKQSSYTLNVFIGLFSSVFISIFFIFFREKIQDLSKRLKSKNGN